MVILIGILLIAVLVLNIYFLSQKRRLFLLKTIQAIKTDHEKSQLKTQLEIQESIFQKISREIHDNIGLSLTLAKLSLITIDHSDCFKRTNAIELAVDLIAKTIEDLNDISKSFNSDAIASIGLITALELELDKISRSQTHEVTFIKTGTPIFLEPQTELILFRISQEALNNILKHARAKNIRINISYNPDSVVLEIADDGVGFNYDELESMRNEKMTAGLKNMQMRAKLINGTCTIESSLSYGTSITIKTPI